jgi:hypothetical protein
MKKVSTLVCAMLTLCVVHSVNAEMFAYPSATSLPYDDTRVFPRDPELLTGYDFNLSAERFTNALFSKTNERERIKANMYLLGVLDSSEGREWCGSRQVLPHSRYELLYPYFRHLTAEQKKQRASTLIITAMAEVMPCKKETRK